MSINSLPPELKSYVAPFLSNSDAANTAQVSRAWKQDIQSQLIETRYPERLRELFQRYQRPIGELPLLDLRRDERGRADYIALSDIERPVMRITASEDRRGIAIRTEGHGEGGVRLWDEHLARFANIRNHVFTIFQRLPNDRDYWAIGSRDFCLIDGFDSGDPMNYESLSRLLEGTHPHLRITESLTEL